MCHFSMALHTLFGIKGDRAYVALHAVWMMVFAQVRFEAHCSLSANWAIVIFMCHFCVCDPEVLPGSVLGDKIDMIQRGDQDPIYGDFFFFWMVALAWFFFL